MCLSQGDSWEDWKVSDEQAARAMTDVIVSNPTWRSGPEKRLIPTQKNDLGPARSSLRMSPQSLINMFKYSFLIVQLSYLEAV